MEVVQETFYKAYISIKNLKEPKYFSTWLTKILINNALTFIQKQKLVLLSDVLPERTMKTSDQQEEKIDLLNAIMSLPRDL
ncbi:sigma factor [Salinibacillus xinjiangensis]|uniref:sigma factor n=1 Tax=Salinibacillus xinjiangensis TaxID=1229268 RepID=UPI003899AAB5